MVDHELPVDKRQRLYDNYAVDYPNRFRTGIDFKYAEEPRQLVGMAVLLVTVLIFGLLADNWPSANAPLGYTNDATTGIQKYSLNSSPHSAAFRVASLLVLFNLIVYSFLQTRDGLLVRPHPGCWRIVHAVGLFHLLFFSILAALKADVGRDLMRLLVPNLPDTGGKPTNVFFGTVDLQCTLSLKSLKIQLSKLWFYAHILGWFAKMCIFRNWAFCLFLSFAFETVELSFQWLIPELRECWWDSLFLDVMLSNMVGMTFGYLLLRGFRSVLFFWGDETSLCRRPCVVHHSTSFPTESTSKDFSCCSDRERSPDFKERTRKKTEAVKAAQYRPVYRIRPAFSFLYRFVPFLWTEYHWSFFRTPERLLQAAFLLVCALLSELNVFLIMYAFDIPASHVYHKIRVTGLCFLALSGVAETYHYVNSVRNNRRIGHNAWLYVAIVGVETIVVLRYGKSRFYRIVPPYGVCIPWGITLLLLGIWCFCHFFVVGPERLDVPRELWEALCMLPRDSSALHALVDRYTFKYTTSPAPCAHSKSRESPECAAHLMAPAAVTHRGPSHVPEGGSSDGEVLKTVADFMFPVAQFPVVSVEWFLSRSYLQEVVTLMKARQEKWGYYLWNCGLTVVSWPPMACFLPLLCLIRYYDYN